MLMELAWFHEGEDEPTAVALALARALEETER